MGFLPRAICDHWVSRLVARELNIRVGREQWARTVMYQECCTLITKLEPSRLDVLEISGRDAGPWRALGFKSVKQTDYPEFDICKDRLDEQFDLIIADQVFEHLLWPYRAARNVFAMLRPGGHFMVTTPFLIRVHAVPVDCSRWTALGMRHLLAECGFPLERIQAGSWGNRACVKANFRRWADQTWWRSLRNEADFPVVVWALAKK
jgi:SAM-dependent methyltransferase